MEDPYQLLATYHAQSYAIQTITDISTHEARIPHGLDGRICRW